MFTSLALLKTHVRADDFDDDDTYLAHLLEVAETVVVKATRRSIGELTDMAAGQFPAELTHAALLLAGEWYATREAATAAELKPIPFGVEALIRPYINYRP